MTCPVQVLMVLSDQPYYDLDCQIKKIKSWYIFHIIENSFLYLQ